MRDALYKKGKVVDRVFCTILKYSNQQPKCITENKMRNEVKLKQIAASITAAKTIAVSALVRKTFLFSAKINYLQDL